MTATTTRVRRHDVARWSLAVLLVLLTTLLGTVLAALSAWNGPRHEAGGQVLVTGLQAPGRDALYLMDRYVLDRGRTWAQLAESDIVADAAAARLGEPPGALRGRVHADAPTATTYITVVVEAPGAEQAVRRGEAVTAAAAEAINTREAVPGFPPRVLAEVVSSDSASVDAAWLDARRAIVPGAVLGMLGGWFVLALRHPGRWARQLLPPVRRDHEPAALQALDQSVQIEVLGALLLGQSWRGLAAVSIALFGVLGYALTGSGWPPLAVVLLAGVAARKDLRYAAAAILVAGVSVLPGRIDVVELGGVTPTVLEVAVVIGVALTIRRIAEQNRPRGVFTAPVLAVLGAVVAGCAVGLSRGAAFGDVTITARAIFCLSAYFVIREAFRGRAHQLFAFLLLLATGSSVLALLALPLGLDLLTSNAVDYVVTGVETTQVERVNTPVLELWSPLLVVLAAGVIRLRPRWLWALLLVPCLLLQGLSFDRSTWATLLVLAVAVAALRGGRRALATRATALLAVGVLALLALSAGLFGAPGQAVAERLTSVVTANALAEDSLSDRLGENRAALDTLRESPFVGTGIGVSYGGELVTFDDTLDVLRADPRPWIHNQYLRIWLWMGLIGLVAYGSVVVRLITFAWLDRMRRGRAATLTVSAAAGLAAIGGQAVFATSLDAESAALSVAAVLALMELAGTRDVPQNQGAGGSFGPPTAAVGRSPHG